MVKVEIYGFVGCGRFAAEAAFVTVAADYGEFCAGAEGFAGAWVAWEM
jgi:hypothetical protein